MNPIALVCSMTAAACLTLAAVHGAIWLKDRTAVANLGFLVLAIGVAWFAWSELGLLEASTAGDVASALLSVHAAAVVMVAGMVVFVRFYLRTARPWLGYAAIGVRFGYLLVSASRPTTADYDTIDGVVRRSFAGQMLSLPVGHTSAWHWLGQIGFALLVVFVIDAAVTLWRRGTTLERRRAVSVGGATAIFALVAPAWAALIFAGVVEWPHIEFLFFMPAVLVMAHELGNDVMRTARLTGLLQVSESEARTLSGRLITAQEDERRRIARDLHDDLSQRLAVLAVELEVLSGTPSHDSSGRASELASDVRDVASDIHRLAYQLHPAKLDQLGLVTAGRSWCRELSKQSGLSIDFMADGVPADLPDDVALGLYRILQESLQNVARHSNSPRAEVRLTRDGSSLRLTITDAGKGFNPSSSSKGLGLVSMGERARLLNGTIVVHSLETTGTTVEVAIPLAEDAASQHAGS